MNREAQSALPSTAGPDEPVTAVDPAEHYLNREYTWLEFNRRVLNEALDERTPLLERLGFLAIFNSNLDEFYQKRVGGLKRQMMAGIRSRSIDGASPEEQLETIRRMVLEMLDEQGRCWKQSIKPALQKEGVKLLKWSELTDAEHAFCNDFFQRNLFPVLTPLSVDPGHPFPFISNLSTSLGVMLRHPADHPDAEGVGVGDQSDPSELQFARIKVPVFLSRWVLLPPAEALSSSSGNGQEQAGAPTFRFVPLHQIIRQNLPSMFEGMQIERVEPFRITRNAAIERDEEDVEDLLELIEQELRDRRFAKVLRLEVDDEPSPEINDFLIEELGLEESDVYRMPAELDYTDLWAVHKQVDRPDLKFQPWTPIVPPRLRDTDADIFSVIRNGDLMVHHPYESFSASVERFIAAAANDPKVIAIKLTLYRTATDSPFIPQLIRAAENGKQVVCLVELKARFDEERNVQLAQQLEKAGIHVVYGIVGLKTHTKTSLVVRQEAEGMKCYAHIGTGNYNSKTANLYTDLGLFTCDPALTGDLVELFHFLTGRSIKKDFKNLLVAPVNMRRRFVEMIDREIEHAKQWNDRGADPDDPRRPSITAKMNSLEDLKIIKKLYEASQAGVQIDLMVRGFCCLRPGVPGLSANIRVTSVIGRFLEHSRVYRFANRGSPEFYIGSADWMYRNLNNRVECITPIREPALQQKLQQMLDIMLADQRQCWDMHTDGSYTQRQPTDENHIGTHARMMQLARKDAQVGV